MRRHHIVGIPPSELGGIATPSQDPKGGNAGSGSGSSQEHPARHPGHGANLPLLVFTRWLRGRILIMNCETPSNFSKKWALHIGWRRTPHVGSQRSFFGRRGPFWTTGL